MRPILVLAAAAALSGAVLAQPSQDQSAHHPAGASAPAGAHSELPTAPAARPEASAAAPAQGDMQMKSMREMHERMMAAKTPEERQALMDDHMKAMQDGMAMMGQMKAPGGKDGGMPMGGDMMAKRMDMMEMMMQMMMDREAARAPAGK